MGFCSIRLAERRAEPFPALPSRSYQCGIGLSQYAVGLSKKQGYRLPVNKPVIECRIDSRRTGDDELVSVETRSAASNMVGKLAKISCFRLPASSAITGLLSSRFARMNSSNVSSRYSLLATHPLLGYLHSGLRNGVF